MKFTNPPAGPLAAPNSPTLLPPAPREAASIWMGGVVAPAAQNIMGGIGTAVLVVILGRSLFPDAGMLVFKVASYAGLAMFGAACMIRAFRDEITILVGAYAAGSLDETTEALRRENKRLLDEVEYMKSQGMVAHQWGAREAAERLVQDYYVALANMRDMNGYLARRASMERGMTRAEWETGIKFLQNAGVMDRGEVRADSEEAGLAAIARYSAVSRVRIRAANGSMTAL